MDNRHERTQLSPERRERLAEPPRGGGFRAIAGAVATLAAPVVRRRGGVLARLKAGWGAIVGPEWGRDSWPIALGRDGALKLRVRPTAALELQHRGPLLVERINGHFGRALVTRLIIQQGPLPVPPAAPILDPLPAEEEKSLENRLAGVSDPALKTALARLGRAIAARRE